MDNALEAQLRLHRLNLQNERAQLLQRVQGIERWIAATDTLLSEFDTSKPAQQDQQSLLILDEQSARQSTAKESLVGKTVVEACVAILSREKRPMTLGELTSALDSGGIKLKAKAPARSVAALIYRRAEFVKTAPGTFALANSQSCTPSLAKQGAVVRLNAEGAIKQSERILRETGRSMHVKELFAALKANGFQSRAKRPEAMLSGTLKRSKTFRLVGSDTWDLVDRNEDRRRRKNER